YSTNIKFSFQTGTALISLANLLDEAIYGIFMYKGYRTAAEARSSHPRPQCPFNASRFLYQDIQLHAAHLIQITQRLMRRIHELAEMLAIVVGQRFYGYQHASVLQHDVLCTVQQHLVRKYRLQLPQAIRLQMRQVFQPRLMSLQLTQRFIALRAAFIVFGVNQTSSFVRVADHQLVG